MKTITLFILAAIAAFAQEPTNHFAAAGVGSYNSVFGTFGVRLSDATYTYSDLHVSGLGATLSQGLSQNMVHYNQFTASAIADIGVTSHAQLALGAGGKFSYDISKWSKIQGSSVFATLKANVIGGKLCSDFGFGFSKTF